MDNLFEIENDSKSEEIFYDYRGVAGIGHVRYCTSGTAENMQSILNGAQPFERRHGRLWKRFGLAYNGNLTNYQKLRDGLKNKEDYHLDTQTDTEVMMHLIALSLRKLAGEDKNGRNIKPNQFDVQKSLMEKLDGSYSIVELFADGDLVVVRDPFGFKPMVYGENSDFYAVASESVALEKLGIKNFYSVSPGSCMVFNTQGIKEKQLINNKRKARCQFEFVYFSKEGSVFDNKSIHVVRKKLGENLAKIEPLRDRIKANYKNFVVVPVPRTAIPATESFAKKLGLEYSSAILKTNGKRGFINKGNARKKIMEGAYFVILEEVKGKKVFILDDSSVRGETIKQIIKPVLNAGALEVHYRSTEPPIRHPCFYGIDFPTKKELIANQYNKKDFEQEFAKLINADTAVFQTLDGLVDAIGFKENELCLACLNGNYPTKGGKKLAKEAKKKWLVYKDK